MANWLQAIGRVFGTARPQTNWAWIDRQSIYALWDAYYANTIYDLEANGGQRQNINSELGNASAADLTGLYNPVANVVDLYLHVFDGVFGEDIVIEPRKRATQHLVTAVEQIWEWSNMTIEKQPLCRLAATHGCVGLRVVARNDTNKERRRVYIKPEHPRVIRDVELDDRGNVEAIQLEYEVTHGLAEDAKTIIIREEMDKQVIRTWRIEGGMKIPYDLETMRDNGPRWQYENELGVVPYVLLRHEYTGDTWGRNAFYKARSPIDRLNALMTHTDVQIHRHVRAKWLVAASGPPPEEIDLTDMTVVYIDLRNSTATPFAEPMVAPLDLAGATNQAKLQLEIIEDMMPELKATQGKYLSGQSGETIAELRKPAEDKVAIARANYEDALRRAQQIAVSWGIMLELWDLGTGMGTLEAAERAFREGYEDMRFNDRPYLPTGNSAEAASQMEGNGNGESNRTT